MSSVSDPDQDALYQVIREVRRLFHRLASATDLLHADLKITAAQRAVLEALADDGPRTVPELARSKEVSRQHIQVVANELHTAGLVATHTNPAHRRSPLLELTDLGRTTFATMRSREARLLGVVAKAIAVPHLTQVAELLRSIGDSVEERMHSPATAGRRNRRAR